MDPGERQEKIEFILDHFENPRNYGILEDADIIQHGGNPGCGDSIIMYFKFSDDSTMEKVTFEGEGCTISKAAASMVTEMVQEKTIDEIETIPASSIIDILGKELAMTRPRCATLGLDTVKRAVKMLERKKMMEKIKYD